jgi:hypothetical protein
LRSNQTRIVRSTTCRRIVTKCHKENVGARCDGDGDGTGGEEEEVVVMVTVIVTVMMVVFVKEVVMMMMMNWHISC